MTAENREKKEISAPDYIHANFHPSDRVAVLIRNRKKGATIQRIATADKIAAPSFQEWLRYKNEKDGCDVYIGMNALKPEAHTRTKDDIQTIRHLYLDLDHDGPKSLTALEHSELVPQPSHVLHTSPDKFQVVWRVEEITQQKAEALQHAMVGEFGGDPAATDSTRVLRLPGFANKKYEEDFVVRVHSYSERTYHLQDFKLPTEPVDARPTRWNPPHARERAEISGPRQLSQSERDWAYAKRAIARGLGEEEVMRNIAEFRAQDKYDPQDYARRTVMKAQIDLQQDSRNPNADDSQRLDGHQPVEDQRDVP